MPLKLNKNIDIERLRSSLNYDPDTGTFTCRTFRKGTRGVGKPAGYLKKSGYVIICFDYRGWFAHRLAWAHFYGSLPEGIIDHINRKRDDNRIVNLRLISNRENILNSSKFDGKALIGTTFHKHTGKWQAQVRLDGKGKYLGLYATQEEAAAAYRRALEGVFA